MEVGTRRTACYVGVRFRVAINVAEDRARIYDGCVRSRVVTYREVAVQQMPVRGSRALCM
jgi:hypothetical protein